MTQTRVLRLFLDSASLEDWQYWLPTGLFYGVTTNPVLLERAGLRCDHLALEQLAQKALSLGAREVQVQSWGRSEEAYIRNGHTIAGYGEAMVVKIPTSEAGVRAARELIGQNIRVTMTAVYSPAQALLASALGAAYTAPYFGRMNDEGRDGFREIVAMQETVRRLGSSTRVLVASLRAAADVAKLAAAGCDTFTFPAKVAADFFGDVAAKAAIETFEMAAEGCKGE